MDRVLPDNGEVPSVDDITTARGIGIPADALSWSFTQSSGAGGQNVNKVSTRVSLSIDVQALVCTNAQRRRILEKCGGTITVTNQTSRSQWRNRQLCIDRVIETIDEAAAPPPPARRKTRPTRGSVERRLQSKRKASEKKRDRKIID